MPAKYAVLLAWEQSGEQPGEASLRPQAGVRGMYERKDLVVRALDRLGAFGCALRPDSLSQCHYGGYYRRVGIGALNVDRVSGPDRRQFAQRP